ncbi:membrane protein [Siminovitchia terrae]|uniref:DMT family transporter n=1 Tax=Siminovitchia terrae TaxID=1914933 RepID=A0A429X6H7_SIMTE|nr:DMT family transporter [Siminovitchia terrae]RST58873.1 DMT family transporter [Siminovitchia terrae]GIN88950.1 membrane protein [Siminovitchia terrae]GIN95019.1 membrane protein [Siminovitchia terrae]
METSKINPYVAVILAVISISTSAILVKLSTAEAGVIAFYRMWFSLLIMAPIFFLKYVKELKEVSKREWLYSALAGIFLSFHFILWFESLEYTSVASSTVLVTLQPLFAFFGTFIIFKERFSYKAIVSATIAVIGSIIISWGDFRISGSALFGDMLALAACALITAYLLIGQMIRKKLSLMTYTFIVYFFSAIVLTGYVLIIQEPLYPYPTSEWIYFLLLAILPNLLGHSVLNWALRWISTTVISMAILFEPVGATILAHIILGEKVFFTQIAGGIIIILSVSLFIIEGTRR